MGAGESVVVVGGTIPIEAVFSADEKEGTPAAGGAAAVLAAKLVNIEGAGGVGEGKVKELDLDSNGAAENEEHWKGMALGLSALFVFFSERGKAAVTAPTDLFPEFWKGCGLSTT